MMKKFFWLMATVLISSMSLTSCGGSDDDNPVTPNTPQQSKKFDVYASVVLDKNLADYGYMEVTYTSKGKTETLKLKKGDASDQLPSTNNLGNIVLNYIQTTYSLNYSSDNFIVRNVVLKDLSTDENAVFKYKFIADAEHPTPDGDKCNFAYPGVIGYTTGGITQIRSSIRVAKGLQVSKLDEWLGKQATELTVTFGPSSAQE